MARNAAGRHQHGIEADVADAVVGMLRERSLGGAGDAYALAPGYLTGGIIQSLVRLGLGEDQEAAAPGDDVDLAQRAAPAPGQDAEALGDEERRRPAFGGNAGAECDLPLEAGRLDRSGARPLIAHGRTPRRAPA